MSRIKALVISGYGINCEKELAFACQLAGAETSVIHTRQFLEEDFPLNKFQFILFPGGFSFGDELGAAKALANKMTSSRFSSGDLKMRLQDFVQKGNCILGICNGFQLLVKLGLIPGSDATGSISQSVSLAANDTGCFGNRWVNHRVNSSLSVFTKGLDQLFLPIRHGEGRFVVKNDTILKKLASTNQIVMQYADREGKVGTSFPSNPNGSQESIGGICDSTGRILGMMAHPEAAVFFTQLPDWTRIKERLSRDNQEVPPYASGLLLFKNAVNYLENK